MNINNKNFIRNLVVKSTTENLSLVRKFTKDAALYCGFDEDTASKIVLAVDEACTNIIKHAYKYSPQGEIFISINFVSPKFTVTITDKGNHFNPELVPVPNIKEYYKLKKVGGLGIFLMKKLMDEVSYSSIENTNKVVLTKYLS
ncbi:ATP-binding protein [Melioribacteraceae bacterium 4301-Me]|uniref:ATP-binding protein n=1 Tax=Pyranulibacter aquaticus TaxID=3163344 RepID=UPI00359B4271